MHKSQLDQFKIVIQARMGSKRFPGKVLELLQDKPILEHQVNLLQDYGFKDIAVATSSKDENISISNLCELLNIDCVLGDEDDVFSRYQDIAMSTDKKFIIRLTGDNPIISSSVIMKVLSEHLESGADFTSTRDIINQTVNRYIPKGWSIDILPVSILKIINRNDLSLFDKEHVIPYFYNIEINRHIVKTFNGFKLENISIDYPEDLKKIEEKLGEVSLKVFVNDINKKILDYLCENKK